MSNSGFSFAKRFDVGVPVCGQMPNGEWLKGVFAGVSQDGQEFLVVTEQNKFFPVGFPVSFMMGKMRPDRFPNGKPSAPAVKPSASVKQQAVQSLDVSVPEFVPKAVAEERQAPKVDKSAFPKLQVPERTQRQAASGGKCQAPMVERQAPVARPPVPPVPNAEALEAAAIDRVVKQLQLQAGVCGLRQRVVHTTHDQYEVRASCPAFEIVDVGGKLQRSSISHALGKCVSVVREKLLQKLDYVPSGAYVRLSWEFDRGTDGKLLDKNGLVKAFFQW